MLGRTRENTNVSKEKVWVSCSEVASIQQQEDKEVYPRAMGLKTEEPKACGRPNKGSEMSRTRDTSQLQKRVQSQILWTRKPGLLPYLSTASIDLIHPNHPSSPIAV